MARVRVRACVATSTTHTITTPHYFTLHIDVSSPHKTKIRSSAKKKYEAVHHIASLEIVHLDSIFHFYVLESKMASRIVHDTQIFASFSSQEVVVGSFDVQSVDV